MYRRLKNILGVSLMILAIVISQVPMPEAQAEIVREMTDEDLQVDDTSAHVVTFSMNGGTFRGTYNGYSFQEKTPVLVIDDGKSIDSFPDDKLASYAGYKTEPGIWYTDQACLNKYNTDSQVTKSTTLYKKWYNITSDGTTLADKGFHISADGTILYHYDGEDKNVVIPQSVSTIAEGAFDQLGEVRAVTLPAGIKTIEKNAFSGVRDGSIIYIYDAGTEASKAYGKQLDAEYDQLVYSEYLDAEKTEQIAGIQNLSDTPKEEAPESTEGAGNTESKPDESEPDGNKPAESDSNESDSESKSDGTEPESSSTGSNSSGNESDENSSENKSTESNKADTESDKTDNNSSEDKPTENDKPDNEPDKDKTGDNSPENDSTENSTESDKPNNEPDKDKTDDNSSTDKPAESDKTDNKPEDKQPEESSSTKSSSVIVIEPDQKYTVTFDTGISGVAGERRQVLNGKTISEEVSVDGSQPRILRKDEYTIEKDDGKQETTYTFKGWYKDNACTYEWDFAKDVIEHDTTIYAKWDKVAKSYHTVTYSTTEGNENASNIPEKQKLYEGEKLEKPAKKPAVKNKTFKGWYTSEEDTKSAYKSWGKPLTEDITLYAHFEEKSNTVVFHMNGGGFTGTYDGKTYTDVASLTKKITVGKGISSSDYPKSSSSANFKYSNYSTDSNWYTDKECTNVYSETTLKGDLTLYKRWYYTSSGFTTNAANNVLYKYSGSVADVTIPNTVTVIGKDAFASVGSISTITLPDKIEEVKENAFSGVNNISKDITITGKTEQAKNTAKGLANQYTHLVYKDSGTSKDSDQDSSVVTKAEAGSIQLGAAASGNAGTTNTTENEANKNTSSKGTIALGASGVGTTIVTSVQPSAAAQSVTQSSSSATVVQPSEGAQPITSQPSVVPQQSSTSQSTAVRQNKSAASARQSASGSSTMTAKTTQKPNVTSASAPKGTQHIKDSTPKTGDPLQYRMLIVCAMFSVGVLLILTGNGKKKKFSAS